MIKYISYFILIFCVIKFIETNNILMSSVIITIGILILNSIIPKVTKESFKNGSIKNGDSCQGKTSSQRDTNCNSGYCDNKSKKCKQKINNGRKCRSSNACKSNRCIKNKCVECTTTQDCRNIYNGDGDVICKRYKCKDVLNPNSSYHKF